MTGWSGLVSQVAAQKYKERQRVLLEEAARARQIEECKAGLVSHVVSRGVDPDLLKKTKVL
jgi:hypothetical protein